MTETERRAREFIDAILAISGRYGHPCVVSREDYEQAVAHSVAAARRVAVARERNPA